MLNKGDFDSSNSILTIERQVDALLCKRDIDGALKLIHNFVELVVTEPMCTSQVFASLKLDRLCIRCGQLNLFEVSLASEDPWPERKECLLEVYIVSRLQGSGGHLRLLLDIIKSQPEKDHLILATGISGSSDLDYLMPIFESMGNVRLLSSPRGNFQFRLSWVQKILKASKPQCVNLFNHHQDSVAIAAITPEMNLQGAFYHHGDHHLCLGAHLNYLRHIDLHPMGYHYCRDILGIKNEYLPLTFEDKGFIEYQSSFGHDGVLTTATAARFNKIEIPYYVSYLELIPKILHTTGGRHIHIGKLTAWGLKKIQRNLAKLRVPRDRFIYIEWVPSVWKALQDFKVDIYLASFPYGAGLTLIEALGAGIPVILHQHIYSQVLSGIELGYQGAYSWSDPEKLISHLVSLTPLDLKAESQLARQQYQTYHRPDILVSYLENPQKFTISIPNLAKDFKPRWDEWAAWVVSQQTLSHFIYSWAHRTWRKIRYLIG